MTAKLGLWLDDPIHVTLDRKYFDRLAAMDISVLALMVDTARAGWDPKWKIATLLKLRELTDAYGMELVLTVWPDPVPHYLDEMATGLDEMLTELPGIAGVEFDTEFNWKARRVKGFRPQRHAGIRKSALDIAGDYLVAAFKGLRETHGVRIELTTFTSHTENGRSADVAPHVDRLIPQAYSVAKRNKKPIAWRHTYGPGRMQQHTLDRTLLVEDCPQIGVGLAAYKQKFPGHTPAEAMGKAMDAALEYDPAEIRYWSSKWVLGIRANGYAERFLLGIAR